MYEKVNPSHLDKIADRIAGAIVDLAYSRADDPRIAVEVLIGHGKCHIMAESSVDFSDKIEEVVQRIAATGLRHPWCFTIRTSISPKTSCTAFAAETTGSLRVSQ